MSGSSLPRKGKQVQLMALHSPHQAKATHSPNVHAPRSGQGKRTLLHREQGLQLVRFHLKEQTTQNNPYKVRLPNTYDVASNARHYQKTLCRLRGPPATFHRTDLPCGHPHFPYRKNTLHLRPFVSKSHNLDRGAKPPKDAGFFGVALHAPLVEGKDRPSLHLTLLLAVRNVRSRRSFGTSYQGHRVYETYGASVNLLSNFRTVCNLHVIAVMITIPKFKGQFKGLIS